MQEKSVKFANKEETAFVNTLRGRVKSYFEENHISRFGNLNMVVKTVFMFTLFFVPYLVMITGLVTHPWLIALCWVLMGLGTSGIGLSVMHDANHRSYSKNQRVNRILAYSLNMLGGFYANWQHQHNTLHHGFTNIDGHDEDIDAGEILRFSPNQPLKKIHRYQHIYAWFLYGLMTLTWSINKDFKQLFGYLKDGVKLSREKSSGQLIMELFISKVIYYGYLLVLPIILLPIAWWMVLILYFVMHFITGFTLAVIFQTAHVMPSSAYPLPDDKGRISKNWAIHQMMTTTNYAPKSRVLSWLIGGLNYQVEHHLFPAICHVHYRKISVIVRKTAQEYGVPYHVQPTFRSALHQHYNMLRNLGRGALQA